MLRLTHTANPVEGRLFVHWRTVGGHRWIGHAPGARYANGTVRTTGPVAWKICRDGQYANAEGVR